MKSLFGKLTSRLCIVSILGLAAPTPAAKKNRGLIVPKKSVPVREVSSAGVSSIAPSPYRVLVFQDRLGVGRTRQIRQWLRSQNLVFKASGARFVVVDARALSEREAARAFRKIPGLVRVEVDRLAFGRAVSPFGDPLVGGDASPGIAVHRSYVDFAAEYARSRLPAADHAGSGSILRQAPVKACTLGPHCENGKNPAWAALSVGADLANARVKEILARRGNADAATVAVVDSGFDNGTHRKSMDALSFETQSGTETSGDANIDPDGHGTAVASMIAAKEIGMTNQVHLKVLRVTENFAGGAASIAMIAAAIEKACRQADVVNVSWGSLMDDLFGIDAQKELWYKAAVEYGCIVVKAAGNDGNRSARRYTPKDTDPVVTVSATDAYENLANFSTVGQIRAPGEQTFTLLSKQHGYGANTLANICDAGSPTPVGPVNGTSFAAPATSGIMAMVVGVLRAKGLIGSVQVGKPRLSPEQVALVKRILFAAGQSRPSGVSDALMAVTIADSIGEADRNLSAAELLERTRRKLAGRCQTPPSPSACLRLACEAKLPCVNRAREFVHTCAPVPGRTLAEYFGALKSLDEDELVASTLRHLSSGQETAALAVAEMSARWQKNVDPQNVRAVRNGDVALDVLHAAGKSGLPGFVTLDRFTQLMNAADVNAALAIRVPLGSSGSQSLEEEKLAKAFETYLALERGDQLAFLAEVPNGLRDARARLGLLFAMDLYRDRLDPSVRKALDVTVENVVKSWAAGQRKLFNWTGSSHYPIFDQFLRARSDLAAAVRAGVDHAAGQPKPGEVPEVLRYALNSPELLEGPAKELVALRWLGAGDGFEDEGRRNQFYYLLQALYEDEKTSLRNPELVRRIRTYLNHPLSVQRGTWSLIGAKGKIPGFSDDPAAWSQLALHQLAQTLEAIRRVNESGKIAGAPQGLVNAHQIFDNGVLPTAERRKAVAEALPLYRQILPLTVDLALSQNPETAAFGLAQLELLRQKQNHILRDELGFGAEVANQLKRLVPRVAAQASFGSADLRNAIHKISGTDEKILSTGGLEDAIAKLKREEREGDALNLRRVAAPRPADAGEVLARTARAKSFLPKSAPDVNSRWRASFRLAGDKWELRDYGAPAAETLRLAAERGAFDFLSDARILAVVGQREFLEHLPEHYDVNEWETHGGESAANVARMLSLLPPEQQSRVLNALWQQTTPSLRFPLARLVAYLRFHGSAFPAPTLRTLDALGRSIVVEWIQGRLHRGSLATRYTMVTQWLDSAAAQGSNIAVAMAAPANSLASPSWLSFSLGTDRLSPAEKTQLVAALLNNPSFNIAEGSLNGDFLRAAVQFNVGHPQFADLKAYLLRNPIVDAGITASSGPALLPMDSTRVSASQNQLAKDPEFVSAYLAALAAALENRLAAPTSSYAKGTTNLLDRSAEHLFQWTNGNLLLTPAQKAAIQREQLPALVRLVTRAQQLLAQQKPAADYVQRSGAENVLKAIAKNRAVFDGEPSLKKWAESSFKAAK